jgi:hypothetical protein
MRLTTHYYLHAQASDKLTQLSKSLPAVLQVHDLLQTAFTSSSDATAVTDVLREQVTAAIKELTTVGEKCILLEAPGLVSH